MIDQSRMAANISISEEAETVSKETGIIAIANGDGFSEIFKSLGVDVVIKGGQSMNPSTYEIVKEINKIDSKNIILLPNNKNIILTANQAKKILKRNIHVIPSATIPQGISAALVFNPDLDIERNTENMNKAIEGISTGEVTTAVRDANLYVGEIKKGALIGLANGKVRVISENLTDCVIDLIREMFSGREEVITFYFGENISTEDNKIIEKRLRDCYPEIEIEFHKGGQPLYPYIFSIE
jgi:dihydroxyacetone kinase-like predicted kinase